MMAGGSGVFSVGMEAVRGQVNGSSSQVDRPGSLTLTLTSARVGRGKLPSKNTMSFDSTKTPLQIPDPITTAILVTNKETHPCAVIQLSQLH